MNNNGNFNNGPAAATMSYPFPVHNPTQHPSLMEQTYQNQVPQDFQPQTSYFYNPGPIIQSTKSEKRKQEILTCDACGVEVNSQQMMDAHIKGQKHIKKMKLKTGSTINQTSESTDIDQNPSIPVVTPTIESVPSIESTPPQVVVVKPHSASNEKHVLQLANELAKYNKVTAKYDLIKETGPAHCKQFEVRLTIGDEIYTGIGTSIKRAQQVAADQALNMTVLPKPGLGTRGSQSVRTPRVGVSRGTYPRVRHLHLPRANRRKSLEQKNENLINQKCLEITEDENTILILQNFVDDIERALKIVSDKITEQCKQKNISVIPQLPENVKLNNIEQNNEDPTESFRMLKGAMKVSTLAMRLFFKNDYEYSLVLICANKPTVTLLNDISQELSIGLNAQAIAAIQLDTNSDQSSTITYKIQTHIPDACLTVQCSLLPKHTIRIMLTSPVFRSENFLNLDDQTREQIAELNPDPSDMLDREKCLEAAAEIRHSNWFTRCMVENNSNLIVLRLLRDFQDNQTPLSSLNLWCLALLVYKCQNQPENSPMALFRSVFSCLSSGILLPNQIGPGIIDPCEKEPIDAAGYLTIKERLAITTYAHHILRLIAFEKYDKIFSLNTNQMEQSSMNSTLGDNQME